jgi:hypothetical protein
MGSFASAMAWAVQILFFASIIGAPLARMGGFAQPS